MRRRTLPPIPFLLALPLAATACRAPSPSPPPLAPEAPRLAADVAWLADDGRDGRRAGTDGEAAAARFIAARFAELALEPAGEEGYFQSFEVPLAPRDAGGSRLAWESVGGAGGALEGPELVPLFCSGGGEAAGPLVFGGYGIVSEEAGWNDYEGVDARGAILALVRGTPPDALAPAPDEEAGGAAGADPHALGERDGWAGAGSILHKVLEAKRRGAAGVVLLPHPSQSAEPLLRFDTGRDGKAGIPAVTVSVESAERLFPGYAAAVERLDAGERIALPSAAARATLLADVVRAFGVARNVLALLRGQDRGRVLVVGAHFDHLGRGGIGSLAPDAADEIHNGADDNASGTAVVLELARCLAPTRPECDVLFALWSGEELGLLGSTHWVEHPTVPLGDVVANLNLDMVGRAGGGALQVLGAGSAQGFARWVEEAAPAAGLRAQVDASGQGVGGSDHQTFLRRSIPALHLFTGIHGDYHRPSDDAERFEAEGAARVTDLVLALVERMESEEIAWVEPPAPPPGQAQAGGFRTRFGSQPDYSYPGPGLRLAGTSPNSPAERAGLLPGDVVLTLDEVRVDSIYDLMYALNAHKPGDVVPVRFERDGAEQEVRVTLASPHLE